MLPTSIATVSLSGDLKEKLDAISAAGFDGVEIFENDFLAYPAGPGEVGRMVRDAGLKVTVFQPFRDFEGMPEPQRARAFDRAERKFDVMQALGTDLMLVCSNVSPAALGGVDRAAEDFRELGERAAKRGLRIGYEALAWGRHVFDHRDAWEIVRRADHPAIGLILDSFHTLARKIDPDSIRRIPGDRIFLVQVADAPLLDMDLLSWSRHFRNMPGQGGLDITGFLTAVKATGYRGYLSLEIFNDQFRAGSAKQVAVDGRRSLIAAGDLVERSAGARSMPIASAPGARLARSASSSSSSRSTKRAVPSSAGSSQALGFRRAGRHVSKDVEWWRQGAINLVINSEREGFAHASYITHGPSVCALGLRVEDAQSAMARARSLLAQPFTQAVGPGELELPAIRGLGGSLLYFTDPKSALSRVWEIEFRPDREAEDSPSDGALVSIDHVSQSMEYDEMLSWLLFYTSIFEMDRTPQVDVADPAGLVRSQVVENRERTVRIALNGAAEPSDALRSIPLGVLRLGGAAHRLRQRGYLRVGENSCGRAASKCSPCPTITTTTSKRGSVSRRSSSTGSGHLACSMTGTTSGEYFQLYTEPFADRFFFEIVQRKSGYQGYGAR